MDFFRNKVAVITGAGSGIGRALAVELARRGARLVLPDIDMAGLERTRSDCGAAEVRLYRLDASNREAFFAHAEQVRRDFGTAHLVFNNAGATLVGTIEHLTIDEIEWQLGINLWGVVYGTKAFLPMLLAQRQGWIVNISSVFGLIGYPAQGAYNISKFGVRGLTECLWAELQGSGVQAVCVHPGALQGRAAAGPAELRLDRRLYQCVVDAEGDLAAQYLCRLCRHMDAQGLGVAVAHDHRACQVKDETIFAGLIAGYVKRTADRLPRQGRAAPWRVTHHYPTDRRHCSTSQSSTVC